MMNDDEKLITLINRNNYAKVILLNERFEYCKNLYVHL